MSYDPNYIKPLLNSPLPDSLVELIEPLSEKVHDRWAYERLSTGWVLGKERSDKLKTHPSIIPYSQLSEAEKNVDRATVETVLKLLLAQGYRVEKEQ
ncbi:RyR domain-containing protein [Paraglaciecola aestuariivivens]